MGYKLSDDDFKNKSSLNNAIEQLGGSNVSDENGYTPLCYIALNGNRSDLIVYLVNDKSADASKVCDKGQPPLELACMSGNIESIKALTGQEVYDRDSDGNIQYTDVPKPAQPKKDAAGNPIPKRDDEDEIIYIKYKSGIPGIPNGIPFPLPAEVSNEQAEAPITQYTAHRVLDPEKSTKDKPVYTVDEVYKVPPDDKDHPLPSKIIYKLDKDGNHQPMRDDDGTPLKQYDRKTKKDINAKDEKGNIINKNKFEYVWDYEYLPEYEVNYCEKTTHIINSEDPEEPKKSATVTPKEILAASSNKDVSILDALAESYPEYEFTYHKYDGTKDIAIKVWDPFLTYNGTALVPNYKSDYFNESHESPLICACRMQLNDTVDYILKNICLALDPYKDILFNSLINIHTYIFKALTNRTREINDVSESAISIARSYNDKSLAKLFIKYIPDKLRGDFISEIDSDDYWPGYGDIVNS